MVYIENSISYTFPFMFQWFQRKTQILTSSDFISFSRMGLSFAMCDDGGTIYFHFFCSNFQLFDRETLRIQSQLSIKNILKFHVTEVTKISRRQIEVTRNSDDGEKFKEYSDFKLKNGNKFPRTTRDLM